jgi:Nitrile hydratase beta subunit
MQVCRGARLDPSRLPQSVETGSLATFSSWARWSPCLQGYDQQVERAVHDRGGWPTDARIDRSEHELADWELLADALVGTLVRGGVMNVDELRRGIESMPPVEYERASYYERWLYSVETALTEKGILAPGELDQRLGG